MLFRSMSDPHYPIGELSYTSPLTAGQKQQYLTDIEQTPAQLRAAPPRTWSAQMGILQGSRGTEPAKNALTILHFSFLNTVESTVIKAEIAHRSRVQGIWSTAVDL